MKNTVILFVLLITLSMAKAQKKQNVYFFKNNGKEVSTKDSADFVRVIQEPDSGETNFVLQELFLNGKRKTVGKVSAFEPKLVPEGTIVKYNQAGRRISISTYEQGRPVGMAYQYFNDGTMHKQIENVRVSSTMIQLLDFSSGINDEFINTDNKLIYLADSLGVVHVKDGNGHVIDVRQFGENKISQEGDYKDGFKDGVWKGSESLYNINYVETYVMGKFIVGESISNGKKYTYTTGFEPPRFKGGNEAWSNLIKNNLNYPKDAARDRISGVVIASFVVDKNGSVKDIKITKSVYPSIDEEARRVLFQTPVWIPAKMRGVPIDMKHSQSFNFRLQ